MNPHHGQDLERILREQGALRDRFIEQTTGAYSRKFPDGRIGCDDDGELTYAIANDDRHGTIIIRFAHPTEWVGLDVNAATELRDQLTERILALRGIKAD
ncbi:hypothetical protein [Planctomycetes bacterium TBK1r]|uniref:DUF2470 domain-containing protein n=1 Tax=Stieleria magnilauensis TaxID=2527963 RepID=A0ABX5XZS1_9BACT|nr:hypothetical protein TBK1r_59720 [Planctomycetes bacterium TBK1r]QDV87023.1 hypothetical protein TBK1r_60500 [Planctomycetes bacterium TBK1r]